MQLVAGYGGGSREGSRTAEKEETKDSWPQPGSQCDREDRARVCGGWQGRRGGP